MSFKGFKGSRAFLALSRRGAGGKVLAAGSFPAKFTTPEAQPDFAGV